VINAYPLSFFIGPIEITGFGITMMLVFLVAAWVVDRGLKRHGYASDYSGDLVLGAVVGGILGAKLWYAALHGPATLISREGLVYYGGFLGGSLGVMVMGWRRRVPVRWTMHLMAPALAAGYAIGRVGCFVVGDDYGSPTGLPWAVAFPQGSPPSMAGIMASEFGISPPTGATPDTVLAVHPTQLYEVVVMLAVFALLWAWRTRSKGTGWLFGAYLVFAGIERFAVEFLRAKDDRFLAGLTYAQGVSVVLMVVGATLWVSLAGREAVEPGDWLRRGAGDPKTAKSRP
jgi:phosphatidylglycerol:prolipoprotein diacylglycerol transferase